MVGATLNTIANYDQRIIPLLASPARTAWGVNLQGVFEEETPPEDPDSN